MIKKRQGEMIKGTSIKFLGRVPHSARNPIFYSKQVHALFFAEKAQTTVRINEFERKQCCCKGATIDQKSGT